MTRLAGLAYAAFVALTLAVGGVASAARPAPSPSPDVMVTTLSSQDDSTPTPVPSGHTAAPEPSATPTPDQQGERFLALARGAWRARTDVPFVRYGALIRYDHNGHVFDNWWDAYFRPSDGALALHRLVDPAEDRHRLAGVPFSIFGVKIFDTNKDAEPIRIDEPRITPAFSFGILSRFAPIVNGGLATPTPVDSDYREIEHLEVTTRVYDVRYAGTQTIAGVDAIHLTLRPLRDPATNRIRDLWLDPADYRTMQMRVQGVLNGKPYDGVPWMVHYVVVNGRNYMQQVVAEQPLHFGFDTTIPHMEFDFFDYHFPTDVPKFTFDGRIF